MLAPVARLLREHTADTHEQIVTALGLLEPELTRSRLRAVLARIAGYWQSTERRVDAWAIERPDDAAALLWPRRRRVEILHQDLLHLGMTVRAVTEIAEPESPFAAAVPSEAEVYGWVYVSEVTTLGGAAFEAAAFEAAPLEAAASDAAPEDDGPLADVLVFQPYAEGSDAMWSAYLNHVQTWTGDSTERRDALVTAARTSFDALEQWLSPVSLYAPAGRRL